MSNIKSDTKISPLVIEGVTEEGQKFRPSDWADRISGELATFQDKRVHYSPLLQPSVTKEGNSCVILDPSLEMTNPVVYKSLLAFAKANHLKICNKDL